MTSYTANNKLIFSWNKGARAVPASLLSSYAESIIFDGIKRTFWHKGYQYGNSYYGSLWGENFNDFLNNTAKGAYSHAEGSHSTVIDSGIAGHAEGIFGIAAGIASSVQGAYNYVGGEAGHAEGYHTSSYARGGHTEGGNTTVSQISTYGHAEGYKTKVSNEYSHAEGEETEVTGKSAHAEGYKSKADGQYSHAEGGQTTASAIYSHAEGEANAAHGNGSHAEGLNNVAEGHYSHVEGEGVKAITNGAHAEGKDTVANSQYGHSEGHKTYSGINSFAHAEGEFTYAIGEASHVEGVGSYAVGHHSHAEGKSTYAIGEHSFTIGEGTQAYNNGEAALGKYNKSNTSNGHKTIVSIGDGTSYTDRHNVVEITNSYSYVANKSYFGDYMFAPLTYSYVDYTGADKPLNILIKALLDEADYKKPILYTKFTGTTQDSGTWDFTTYHPSYLYEGTTEEDVCYVDMEIGSYFRPGVHIYWPDVDDDKELATRMAKSDQTPDYPTIQSYRTGYSYGLAGSVPISFYYDRCTNWDYEKTTADVEAFGTKINESSVTPFFTYIMGESDYNVVENISLSYRQSSYMLYEQLKRVGLYQISYGYLNPWFEGGEIWAPQKLVVRGRYKWYCGFADRIPDTKEDLLYNGNPVTSGFLKKNEEFSFTYCTHEVTNMDSRCGYFWCACPADFELVDYNDRFTIDVLRGNGVNFDLVTDVQPLNVHSIKINLGMNNDRFQKWYSVYYVKFNLSPLGDDENDVVRFKFGGSAPIPDAYYLLTEDGMPYGLEDASGRILHDGVYKEDEDD